MSQRQDAPESPVRTHLEWLHEIRQLVEECATRKLEVAGLQRMESWGPAWEELANQRPEYERMSAACVTLLNGLVRSVDPTVRARCLDDLREITPLLREIFAWQQPHPDIRSGLLRCELPDGRKEHYLPTSPRHTEARERLRALRYTFQIRMQRFIEEWGVWIEPSEPEDESREFSGTNKKDGTGSKRSTEPGEARVKLIAALTKHHEYANGGALQLEPASNNELAREAGVDKGTASVFFQKEFGGHGKYKSHYCQNPVLLAAALRHLNGEYTTDRLFGGTPPGEAERDDE